MNLAISITILVLNFILFWHLNPYFYDKINFNLFVIEFLLIISVKDLVFKVIPTIPVVLFSVVVIFLNFSYLHLIEALTIVAVIYIYDEVVSGYNVGLGDYFIMILIPFYVNRLELFLTLIFLILIDIVIFKMIIKNKLNIAYVPVIVFSILLSKYTIAK